MSIFCHWGRLCSIHKQSLISIGCHWGRLCSITTQSLNCTEHSQNTNIWSQYIFGCRSFYYAGKEKKRKWHGPIFFLSFFLVFLFYFFLFFLFLGQAHHCGTFIQKHSFIVTIFLSLTHSHVSVCMIFSLHAHPALCLFPLVTVWTIFVFKLFTVKHFGAWADFQISWTMEGSVFVFLSSQMYRSNRMERAFSFSLKIDIKTKRFFGQGMSSGYLHTCPLKFWLALWDFWLVHCDCRHQCGRQRYIRLLCSKQCLKYLSDKSASVSSWQRRVGSFFFLSFFLFLLLLFNPFQFHSSRLAMRRIFFFSFSVLFSSIQVGI